MRGCSFFYCVCEKVVAEGQLFYFSNRGGMWVSSVYVINESAGVLGDSSRLLNYL